MTFRDGSHWMHGLGLPLLLLSLLVSGCRGSTPKGEVSCLSCDDARLVRIVSAGEARSGRGVPFDHPLTLDRKDWETVVRSVTVQSVYHPLLGSSYRGSAEPGFSDEEVLYLAETLRQAFQRATPQELVVFALARTSDEGLLQLTSGAWFSDQAKIHLQLANYRVTITMPSIRRQIWADPLFTQADGGYEPVAGTNQEIVKLSQRDGNLFRPHPAELAIDYGALVGHPRPSASEPPTGPVRSTPSPSLEERLEQLKHLYQRGLISEDEYRLKKQQLLDRL
jgi:hypothetical protein